jgi:2-iminobutanoate/2-iminopropanoate deaminase
MKTLFTITGICVSFLSLAQQPMSVKTISSADLSRPAAAYSHAIVAGNVVYVSGQAGVDFSTGKTDSDFEKQARQAFENVKKVVEASGSDMAHVIKVTAWLTDAANFDKLNKLYSEYFPKNPPARSTPIVDLPKPEYKISLEAVAVLK